MNPKRKHKRKLLIFSMVRSHYPRCLQCFPTQENLATKTLNPKVTSFVIQVSLSSSSPSKSAKKHLNSQLQPSKSCHVLPNRDTIGAYDPRYDQLYPEKHAQQVKNRVTFFQNRDTIEHLENLLSAQPNRDTLMKSCHDFSVSLDHKFEAKYNKYNRIEGKPKLSFCIS